MKGAILFDSTMCIGCEACVAACKEQNNLPATIDPKLTAYTWTVVEQRNKVFIRRMCMHCESPTCVSVCPVQAFQKEPNGPVLYDASRCIGCRYCIMACPFRAPRYQWDRTVPIVQKCIMCPDRIIAGKAPACASVCPTGATMFGDRDELIREARSRLWTSPKNYVPRIYGLEEVGGTSVLILSSVPFASLGLWSDLPLSPLPTLTWQVLSKIPDFVVVGGALLYGVWWITNRRNHVQDFLAREASRPGASVPTHGEGREERMQAP
jgi:formate dehydrogenase iron-sulfur subunit